MVVVADAGFAAIPDGRCVRRWALPFAPAPPRRAGQVGRPRVKGRRLLQAVPPKSAGATRHSRRHKSVAEWARQAVLQTKRWLPHRRLVVVADASFAAIDLIAALRRRVCLVTRLRIDASLFAPAPPRRAGQVGRPRVKGRRLPTFKAVLADPKTVWVPVTVTEWYGGKPRRLEIVHERRPQHPTPRSGIIPACRPHPSAGC